MNKILKMTVPGFVLLVLVISLPIAFAQKNNAKTPPENSGTLHFSISIPQEINTWIARTDEENISVFAFQKNDGSKVFLFSLNKIPEKTWMVVKDQLDHYKVLDHKEGNFYFVEYTDRSRIKGTDGEAYQEIYAELPELIESIRITE